MQSFFKRYPVRSNSETNGMEYDTYNISSACVCNKTVDNLHSLLIKSAHCHSLSNNCPSVTKRLTQMHFSYSLMFATGNSLITLNDL